MGRWFAERPYVELLLILLLVILLLVPPAFVIDIAPSRSAQHVYEKYSYVDACMAWSDGRSVFFETSEEFAKLARFEEWESKYTWFGIGEEVLAIDRDSVQNGAHLEFYSGNCVKVYSRGYFGGDSTYYYIVPEGVVEALIQYIQEHRVVDGTAGVP